jgi:outer membrane protein assembly factor BamB
MCKFSLAFLVVACVPLGAAASATTAPASAGAGADILLIANAPPMKWMPTAAESFAAYEDACRKAGFPNEQLREQAIQARLAVFLRAALERYTDAESRAWVLDQLASCLIAARQREQANACLAAIVDESPHDPARAAKALGLILQTEPESCLDGERWIRYAIERLLALGDAGLLDGAHPLLDAAWKARLAQARRLSWHADATFALDIIATGNPPQAWLTQTRGMLLSAAGRVKQAVQTLREIDESPNIKSLIRSIDRPLARPSLPQNLGLEGQWRSLDRGAIPQDRLLAFLRDSAADEALLPTGTALYASAWLAMDRALLANAALARLAKSEPSDEEVAAAAGEGMKGATLLLRRQPLSPRAHALALRAAEEALRRGEPHAACRLFEDVLKHSSDESTRKAAQVGVWMTLVGRSEPADVARAAFEGFKPDELYPWMGQATAVDAIRRRVLGFAPEPSGHTQLTLKPVALPPAGAWPPPQRRRDANPDLLVSPRPMGQLFSDGQNLVLCGGALVACWQGSDLSNPRWHYATSAASGADRKPTGPVVSGLYAPAMGGGKVYVRFGRDRTDSVHTGIAAIDVATGQLDWVTQADGDWGNMLPNSDGVLADGKLYLLARGRARGVMPVYRVCLDARSGRVLWRREMAALGISERQPQLVQYGNDLVVSRGRLYGCTGAGVMFCADIRDGMVIWARKYDGLMTFSQQEWLAGRQGAQPIISASAAVFMTRDYSGIVALNPDTGEPLWDNWTDPSDECLGRHGALMIVRDDFNVAAIDIATGLPAWSRRMDQAITAARLEGNRLWVATGKSIYRFEAAAGTLAGTAAAPSAVLDMAPHGAVLAAVVSGCSVEPPKPQPAPPKGDDADAGPIWAFERADAMFVKPPQGVDAQGTVLSVSRGVVERLRVAPVPEILWRINARPDVTGVRWTRDAVVILTRSDAHGHDPRTGALLWHYQFDGSLAGHLLLEKALVCRIAVRGADVLEAMDLVSGNPLWRRNLRPLGSRFRVQAVSFDGGMVYVRATVSVGPGAEEPVMVALGVEDGGLRLYQRSPREAKLGWLSGGSYCQLAGNQRQLLVTAAGTTATYDVPAAAKGAISDILVSGQWILATQEFHNSPVGGVVWRQGTPKPLMQVSGKPVLVNDRLLVISSRGATITNLQTAQQTACALPIDSSKALNTRVVDWSLTDSGLALMHAYGYRGKKGVESFVRLSWFDMQGGLLGSRLLGGVQFITASGPAHLPPLADADIVADGKTALAADAWGIRAYEMKAR